MYRSIFPESECNLYMNGLSSNTDNTAIACVKGQPGHMDKSAFVFSTPSTYEGPQCSALPDNLEDGVSVAEVVRLDMGVGQSSPQLPHRLLAAQVRHGPCLGGFMLMFLSIT